MSARVAAIEKWTAVADICRCLHNFNGVLQITAAFTNAAVYRMKKTWDKVPKNVSKLPCFFRTADATKAFLTLNELDPSYKFISRKQIY